MSVFVECPTGCHRPVDPGKLMCGSCWSQVPKDLQRKVYTTWRAYKKQSFNDQDGLRAARIAYTEARDNAVAAIA